MGPLEPSSEATEINRSTINDVAAITSAAHHLCPLQETLRGCSGRDVILLRTGNLGGLMVFTWHVRDEDPNGIRLTTVKDPRMLQTSL
jgi:hypothetical protein